MDELIIDDANFEEYFLDIRKHKPQKGHIIACFRATAEFVDGRDKRDVIELLRQTDKALAISQVMRKLEHAIEEDAYRVPYEMAIDLIEGLAYYDVPEAAVEKVAKKKYKYTMEMHFYTNRENVPKDDTHWSIVEILNLEEYLDHDKEENPHIKSEIIWPEKLI